MFESWSVGVFIRATSNIARVMMGGAQATRVLNSQIGAQNKLLTLSAERQKVLRAQATLAAGVASAGTLAILTGIRGAADLQSAMTSVGIATGLATGHLGDFYSMAVRLSGVTAQSVTTIAKEMAVAASSGLNDPARLKMAFPQMAKASDILFLSPKHVDPVHATQALAQFSHLFGAYQGKPLHEMIDRAVRAIYVQPEGIDKMVSQGRMFIPLAMHYGVTMKEIFSQIALMGQTGFLQGRGGAGLANAINYVMGGASLTGYAGAKRRSAMIDLGVADSHGRLKFQDDKGHLLLTAMLAHLAKLQQTMAPGAFGRDLYNAMGLQGQKYLLTILRPESLAQAARNTLAMNRIAAPGAAVETLWQRYMQTFWGRWNGFVTNAANVLSAIWLPMLPKLTQGLSVAGKALGGLADWLMVHPKQASIIAVASFAAVAASAAFAARNMWMLNAAILANGIGGKTGAGVAAAERVGPLLARASWLKGAFLSFLLSGGASFVETIATIASRFIPVVGIISIAIALLYGTFRLAADQFKMIFTGRSEIGDAIARWWGRNEGKIGYTIGYAFGMIGKMLQQAISGLMTYASAGLGSFFSNIGMLMTPGGAAGLIVRMQADADAAAARYAKEHHVGFGSGFGSGYYQGANGQRFNPNYDPSGHGVHIHVDRPIIQIGPGVTEAHARQMGGYFWDQAMKHAKAASDNSGSLFPVSPFHPAPAFGSP